MCGITGFLDPDHVFSEADLRRMNACITRRGPDGEGYFHSSHEGVGLAMRRLAIIDISGGWQPVYNEDRSITVVFNGEIYNFQDLRRELESLGHAFRTQSDSEVIAHLYEQFGPDFAQRLQGMFAIAIWDANTRSLLLARDRLGIKPLFTARVGRAIVFGSEIKSILACGKVDATVDPLAVDQFFSYTYIPAPRTIYRDIKKFPPAHFAIFGATRDGHPTRYWSLPRSPHEPTKEPATAEAEVQIETALLNAVKSHMVSDVPIGAFLSGGVDSSLIVAMMTRFSSSPPQTFTVAFEEASQSFIDERVYAREMATRYGLNHHEIVVSPDVGSILPEITGSFDEPFADDSVIPSYYISKATSSHVKVALTGLGGDELFAGYKRHLAVHLSRHYRKLPVVVRKLIGDRLAPMIPEFERLGDRIDHLKRFTRAASSSPARQYQQYLTTLPPGNRLSLFSPEYARILDDEAVADLMLSPFNSADVDSDLERALRTDLATYLPDDILALSDRLSMWHSLELRVPFLDHPLVELAATLPAKLKISGTQQKAILRKVASRWLPDSILNHRKQGFESPMGPWLRGPLLPLLDELTSPASLGDLRLFDPIAIRRLRDDHIGGRRKNSKILFSILMFVQWARQSGAKL
jgi:asparagine synthase (glutamine-hydrolysing)